MWEIVSAIVRVILIMSVSGSVITLLLFALKPFIKNRISKAAQYYLWIIAVFAFLIPLFILITLPVSTPVTRMQYVIEEYVKSNAEWQEQVAQELYGVPYAELDVIKQVDITYRELKTRKIGDYGMLSLNLLLFGTAFLLKELAIYVGYIAKLRRERLPARERELSFLPENSPRLYRNPLAAAPMLVGVFNSSIYLPDVEYTDEQLGNILRHELTHWRRRDVALKWLATLAVQIHWFNPIAYFMRREFDRACELACDEAVIRNLDAAGKQSYGDTLIDVAADVKKSKMIVSVTMCEEKKKLKERLIAIMKYRKKTKLAVLITAVLAVTLTGSALAFGAQGALEHTVIVPPTTVTKEVDFEYSRTIPFEQLELIPESVSELTFDAKYNAFYYEYNIAGSYEAVLVQTEYIEFDENGRHRGALVGGEYLVVIERDSDGELTGMLYRIPALSK